MAVLVHRANMHSEPQDWISRDSIHMIDETASVTWIKMRVRVWGGIGWIFFFLFNFCTGYDCESASKSPHNVLNLTVIDQHCVHAHTGAHVRKVLPPEIEHG